MATEARFPKLGSKPGWLKRQSKILPLNQRKRRRCKHLCITFWLLIIFKIHLLKMSGNWLVLSILFNFSNWRKDVANVVFSLRIIGSSRYVKFPLWELTLNQQYRSSKHDQNLTYSTNNRTSVNTCRTNIWKNDKWIKVNTKFEIICRSIPYIYIYVCIYKFVCVCVTSLISLGHNSYLGFLFWHLWMRHPLRARVNTCVNVCT